MNYTKGTVQSVTTPLDGSPSAVTAEVDNPAYVPNADPPPDPPIEPRIVMTFAIEHEKTIDRLINLIGDTTKTVSFTTDENGAVTHVTYADV